MRIFTFLTTLGLTLALVYALSIRLSVGGKMLPRIGAFFSPMEGFWSNAEPFKRLPNSGEMNLPGLTAPVEVSMDERGVPHIFAQNRADALRVQGYLTAKDRLWQMDITSRKMSGRLAEVLGPNLLEVDKMTRRKGFVWAAERDVQGWKAFPEEIEKMQAFCDGVNAYISTLRPADYPLEFKLMDYKPSPWTLESIAHVTEGMAESLCLKNEDLETSNTLDLLGDADFKQLFPDWNPKQQPIVEDKGQWKNMTKKSTAADSKSTLNAKTKAIGQNTTHSKDPAEEIDLSGQLSIWENPNISQSEAGKTYQKGSNNWAISGKKTASNQPMLANDPHLMLTLPSIWYEVQIHTPESNAYGVSLPGIPGIIIGFNENIAWGVTNGSQDVADWHKIQWKDEKKGTYLLDGAAKNVDWRVEEIQVAGHPEPVLDSVPYTIWGPVTYYGMESEYKNLAFRWLATDIPQSSETSVFEQLAAGKNFADFQKGVSGFIAPAQNFVFAARDGDIAYQIGGKWPIKSKNQGKYLQDGSQSSHSWQGFIPFSDMPSWKNPARGFVFSANQETTPPSYPYYYNGYFNHSRSIRIHDRLEKLESATVDSMMALQLDNYSAIAADGLAALLKNIQADSLNAHEKERLEAIRGWDASFTRENTSATLYDLWIEEAYRLTFDEFMAWGKEKRVLFPPFWVFNDLMSNQPTNKWFDMKSTAEKKETASEIATTSFRTAVFSADSLLLFNQLAWGKYNSTRINHLGRIPGFGRTDIQTNGNRQAPNAVDKDHGPSWRMIVDLGKDSVQALGIYPGGQSGNPGSPLYDNMVDDWASGKYYPLHLMRNPQGIHILRFK